MITLITGLPGNGKTLYALSFVKEWSERENRPVFYSGITDLKLPWEEIEAEKWFECPSGSIVVIDECQRVFRPRTISKDIPEHVSKLETHRHLGIDIVLITQHPMLADSSVRRLTGKHNHVVRTFGAERATIHEWGSVKDSCDKSSGRVDSIKHHWKFNRLAFDYYKSAELHTVKRNIPMKVKLFVLVPVLIIAAVIYMVNFTKSKTEPIADTQAQTSGLKTAVSEKIATAKSSYKNALEESKQYVYEATSRVEGLPQTAPKYDEITKPTIAPVAVGCVASKTSCRCFTQQATPIKMEENLCRDIVQNGYFQDFDVNGKNQNSQRQVERAPASVPVRDSVPAPSHSGVTVMPFAKPSIVASTSPVREREEFPPRPQFQNRPQPNL